MPLPGNLTAITLTGTYLTATGVPCSGTVTFNLDSVIADATGSVILYPSATVATLDANGSFSIELAATNDTHLYPEPFTYRVTERLTGAQPRVYSISLPSSLAPTVDLSTLTPTQPITPVGVTITGTPTTGQVPTATGPTTADWQTPSGGGSGDLLAANNLSDLASASAARANLGLGGAAVLGVGTSSGTVAAGNDTRITGALQSANNLSDLGSASTARTNLGLGAAATAGAATAGAEGIIQLAGDLGGGTAAAPQVTSTHLAAALPVAQGGTGQASTSAAYNALAPTTTLGDLAYANGAGTNTRLPGTTSATKQYLQQTGNGSTSAAPAWGTIAAGDVPTLNQNTTGTAANITGTAAIANGGTGQTSAGAAFNALSPITTLGDLVYGSAANTASRLAGSTSASKTFLVQTGTGSASAAPVWGGIAAGDLPAATTSAVGGVQFDGTATDITFLGVQAAGASGKAVDAGHVHPAYEWMPSDQGLIAWNYDPSGAGTTWVPTSTTNGYLFLTAMILRQSATLTNIVYGLSGAQTSGLTSGENLIGLYNSSGTLLTQTADQTTIWSTTADQKVNTVPWATQQTNLAAGKYYVGFLYNGVVTGAALNFKASGAGTTANAGQTGANMRYGVITGTATSLPGSITLSSMATPSPFNSQWLGFS
jgi:hypothetical protein